MGVRGTQATPGSRYVTLDRLGAGGMGEVWRCRDTLLGRDVAVKRLPSRTLGDEASRRRLLREARAAARLSHPHIVEVFDVLETEEEGVAVVMELVPGLSLEDAVGPGRFTPTEVAGLVAQIADALAHAHELGVLHRDVKPMNVMLRPDGRVKLLDLGLARAWRRSPGHPKDVTADAATSGLLGLEGTPGYIAPEQLLYESPTPATDQYQLAVVAYELLVGRSPWKATTRESLLGASLRETPAPPSAVADVPRAVDAVIARGMARQPGDRYPSIAAFADALTRAARGVEAKRPGPGQPPSARNAFLAVGGLATLALVVLAWSPGVLSPNPSDPPAAPHPLLDPGARLACPIFSVAGLEPPAGWLGAAAADMACRRAKWRLDGRDERVLVPARLLDLPTRPTDGFPADPFDAPDARPRSLARAEAAAEATLDGAVSADEDGGYAVALRYRDRRELEPLVVERRADALLPAVADAVDELARRGALPLLPLDPEVARWTRMDAEDNALADRLRLALFTGRDVEAHCRTLARRRTLAPDAAAKLAAYCAHRVPGFALEARPPRPSGGMDLPELAASLPFWSRELEPTVRQGLLTRIREGQPRVESPQAVRWLAHVEAMVLAQEGETRRAQELLLASIGAVPEEIAAWEELVKGRTGRVALASARGFTAWAPAYQPAWCLRARLEAGDASSALEPYRRCYRMGDGVPVSAMYYGDALLAADRVADAANLAARTSGLAGEYLGARLAAREGRLTEAHARLGDALVAHEPVLGGSFFREGDGRALFVYAELSELLGRGDAAYARLAPHFGLEGDTPRVEPFSNFSAGEWAAICLLAPGDRRPACAAGLEAFVERGAYLGWGGARAYVEGTLAEARGDRGAALARWGALGARCPWPFWIPDAVTAAAHASITRMVASCRSPSLEVGGLAVTAVEAAMLGAGDPDVLRAACDARVQLDVRVPSFERACVVLGEGER